VNDRRREWLETDGLGGFASGTVSGLRTRRYHGLLVSATLPPAGRKMLVAGLDARLETPGGSWWLSTQAYAPDVIAGAGEQHIESFVGDPWPTWTFRLPDGTRLVHEVFMRSGTPEVFVSWRVLTGSRAPALAPAPDLGWARLHVRPFFAGRDFHALMHENPAFSFDPEISGDRFRFRPYAGGPTIRVSSSGSYRHQPEWYRRFVYAEERARGLDFEEDLGAPGTWSFELGGGEAVLTFGAELGGRDPSVAPAAAALGTARDDERARRGRLGGPLDRAADQYLVARSTGQTIIAGYPWFGDWGRDTFISLRGLCLARGQVQDALDILLAWAGLVSEGMLPNCFPDVSAEPEYNTVDASLWYVVAVGEAVRAAGASLAAANRRRLVTAVEEILGHYAEGTRYGIRGTDDGLLAAGVRGQQLTWMDARVDGREVTPRIGKPVEIQALWLNALGAAVALATPSAARWAEVLGRGRAAFEGRFWDESLGYLRDVVDVDHVEGAVDATLRPNQILALGGLPLALVEGARAGRVLAAVESALLTPLGLRSLAPGAPGYRPHYAGGVAERDGAYHQGTVWPWLMGPFVEAYVRVQGGGAEARRRARARFVDPMMMHLDQAGIGHLPEVADAEPPYAPGGCPFQAWSLGELIRLDRVVLAPESGRLGAVAAAAGPGERRPTRAGAGVDLGRAPARAPTREQA
jgi:predicted glycogen debranching enzyme